MTEYQFSDDYLERKIRKLEHQREILALSISCHKNWQNRLRMMNQLYETKKVEQISMFGT